MAASVTNNLKNCPNLNSYLYMGQSIQEWKKVFKKFYLVHS